MSDSGGGFRQGFGFGGGCCAAAVLIPLCCLLLMTMCTLRKADAVVENHKLEEPVRVAKLKAERAEKLRAAGAEIVPEINATSEAEVKKQMRIEGVTTPGVMETVFGNDEQIKAIQPLKAAVAEAMLGKVDGEVLMLEELAGVSKGDLMSDVMQRFDAPEHRGETNEVRHYSTAWPDMMYYSYDRADVTFLVKNGVVDLILIGLVYRDAVR